MPKITKMIFSKIFYAIISIIVFSSVTSIIYIVQSVVSDGDIPYDFFTLLLVRAFYVSGVYFIYAIPVSIVIDIKIKRKINAVLAYVISGGIAGIGYYLLFTSGNFWLYEVLNFTTMGVIASIVFYIIQIIFKKFVFKNLTNDTSI